MDGGFYVFPRELKACADRRLNNATIRRLWQGFCCQAGQIVMEEADGVFFRTGAIPVPEVPGKAEFVIRVTEQGMAVAAKDYSGLARGVLVLMMRIEPVARWRRGGSSSVWRRALWKAITVFAAA